MSSLLGFYGLSLLDALNPSAIAVTLFLLLRGGPYRSRVLIYVGAIFTTYLLLGLMIYTGLDALLRLADSVVVQRIGYALAAIVGTAMLLYALFPPKSAKQGLRLPKLPDPLPRSVVFFTGVTITLAEFSTALPYLAALGILRGYTASLGAAAPLLTTYNAIFVLPPILLMLGYGLAESRIRPRIQRWLDKRRRANDDTWLWILGIVGFTLARHGIAYYLRVFGVISA